MAKNDKVVLILERSSENLKTVRDGNDIILEGIFAQFGVVNNYDRIYEEEEYLPQLKSLQKKIDEKRLIGELDHPEKFDISLSKISHSIESLTYNKDNRTVTGRIRLLDTPQGRIAKELVEAGIPISISSRAAGLVEPNKKVKIKKIFTYDLVADPGFENAVLSRMNESLGILNENVAIYDMTSSYPELLEEYTSDKEDNKKSTTDMEYVTADEMNTYSLILKEEIEEIHKKLSSVSEGNNSELMEKVQKMSESVDKMQKYVDYLANTLDKNIQHGHHVEESLDRVIDYTNYVANTLDESIKFTKSLDEKTEQGIKYAEYIKEQVEKGIDYAEYLRECIELGVSYGEYVAEQANKGIKYTEYVAEQANKGIKYTEYVAEQANLGIKYAEHIAEKASKGIEYTEYVAEKLVSELKDTISYADYLAESLNRGIEYSQYIGEQAQQIADYTEFTLNEKAPSANVEKIVESTSTVNYSEIDQKIDELLKSVKKQKIDEANIKLEETKKQKVSETLNESNQQSADKKLAAILNNGKSNQPLNWLTDAPDEYKKIWESLDTKTKETINAQSMSYKLESAYQIKNFWDTHATLVIEKASKTEEIKPLNEQAAELPKLGYNENYLEAVRKGLDKFGRK